MENFIKIIEDENTILLLSKVDGRTYLYDKKTGKITLRPYWD